MNARSFTLCGLFFVLLSHRAHSDEWTHWRGGQRTGIVNEPSGWNGKQWLGKSLWKRSVGEGNAAPLAVAGRVYLEGWAGNRNTVYCFDARTGKPLWSQSYPAPRYGRFALGDQSVYSGPSATPEFDKPTGLLFTLSGDGDLNAWDTKQQGRRVWGVNLYERYGGKRRPEVAKRRKTRRDYGYTTSPLVQGDQLIVEVGGRQGNLVAFDKRTGRQRWMSQNRDEAGHTGGLVPMSVEGIPCVAVLTLRNLVVTRIDGDKAGRTVATFKWTTDFGNNISTPAVFGDSVIITSAYNHFAMCRVQVTMRGTKKIWENKELASGVCSPIIHQGRVYWAWRGVHCVDFKTGKELWRGGNIGAAGSCILTADDRLIVYGNKGQLSLVETAKRSPTKYRQLATTRVFGRTDAWPHVTLANGRVICRDRSGAVRCFATLPTK